MSTPPRTDEDIVKVMALRLFPSQLRSTLSSGAKRASVVRYATALLSAGLLLHCGDSETSRPSDSDGGAGAAGSPGAERELDCTPPPPEREVKDACSQEAGKRCLPADALRRRGVAYSGYRDGQDPRVHVYPSKEEVAEDLALLARGGWTFLRLFDSGPHAELVLEAIEEGELDMKVQLGVWIEGAKADHDEENQEDIARGIELANKYRDIVVGVSVGNETLSDWSSVLTPAADLAEYILQVREAIEQPVTTDEMYPPFLMGGVYRDVRQVVEVVDYLSVHVYAFIDAQWSWNWRQTGIPEGPERTRAMMEAGARFTREAIAGVQRALSSRDLDRPVIIGEAGWKTLPTKPAEEAGEKFRAHPVNQKIFYDDLMDWIYGAGRDEASPHAAFYFEAFDEPWKGEDDGWGLFTVERTPKYTIWCDFPELIPDDEPLYTAADAISFVGE